MRPPADYVHERGTVLIAGVDEAGVPTASIQISADAIRHRTAKNIGLWLLRFASWAKAYEADRRDYGDDQNVEARDGE